MHFIQLACQKYSLDASAMKKLHILSIDGTKNTCASARKYAERQLQIITCYQIVRNPNVFGFPSLN